MKKTKIAWAAGFIDGEGYIGVSKCTHGNSKTRDSFTAVINAGQVSRVPLDELQSILGGTISATRDKYGYHWQWRAYGDKAIVALKMLLPYLVHKKAQTLLVIEFQTTKVRVLKDGRLTSPGVSDEFYERRVELYTALRILNKRRHAERLSEKAPQTEGDAIVQSHGNFNHENQLETVGRLTIQ